MIIPYHWCAHDVITYLFTVRDIFKLHKLFVPVNIGNYHWVLVVAFMEEKIIQFFDSTGLNGEKYEMAFLRYLDDMHKEIHHQPLPMDQWTLHTQTKLDDPKQPNGCDCGLFVLLTIYYLSLDYPLLFSQQHVTSAVLPASGLNPRGLPPERFYQSFLDECRYHLLHSVVLGRLVFHHKVTALENVRVAVDSSADRSAGT